MFRIIAKKSDGLWKWRQDIPFAILNDLSLEALDLEYVSPAVLYFLEKQKRLKILRVYIGPQLGLPHLAPVIAGKEFDFLAVNVMHRNKQRVRKLLEKYHITAKVLFINTEQVVPGNDNPEKELEQTKSAGVE